MKKIFVFDTSVLLTNFKAIYEFGKSDIIIPLKVLEEIDKHKKRHDGVGSNARCFIRILDQLRKNSRGANLSKGVRIRKGAGLISIRDYNKNIASLGNLDLSVPDNQIIAVALSEIDKLKSSPVKSQIVMVSCDIHMRVMCDAFDIQSQNFSTTIAAKSTEDLYSGCTSISVDDALIEDFFNNGSIEINNLDTIPNPNEFVLLSSNTNEKKTGLAIFDSKSSSLKKINDFKNKICGIKPRNKEQVYAFNLLMDPNIEVVSMIGPAGTGKSLLALAAGLEQTLNSREYSKLIVSRPIQPLGKDIGYLPGSLLEKMEPWLAPIKDNFEYLSSLQTNDKDFKKYYNDIIEVEALTYIRGRSIANCYILIDECQNLTAHEMKTILTRVGIGTKIVLTGDIAQIDNTYIDALSNGLSYVIEKFKNQDLSGHITLQRGERSRVATLASKIL